MANIEYGPTSPNATNGSLGSGKHSQATSVRTGSFDGIGPVSRDKLAEPGRIDKSMKWSQGTDKPQLNLTNDPSAHVQSVIRGIHWTPPSPSWNPPLNRN